ncbi:SIMPL domain-containing protein [Bergeyella sp. RCAD1439]|uniref:SIMPL domain-containing protein n=1 Tax=Bergeyella anatis TaxID=3113737 RepID=UPI002E17110E|nr:SIMPL domain-containing protein [Bergeyella sp. RCAD1439]MEC5395165.1 SIMPL domain-containing protein [Bergeyella sp. RCAD1439]
MNRLFTTLFLLVFTSLTFAQKNFIDRPYIEIAAHADTLVVPDKIYIAITIDEADTKNKKSVEQQERIMESTLKKLNINTEKQLSLLDATSNFKNYFLRGQNIIKSKRYSLQVSNAVTAGRVLAELENAGIANTSIEKTEYSKADELVLGLKAKALKKAKTTGEILAKSIGQKIGKALYISDKNYSSLQGQALGLRIKTSELALMADSAPEPISIDFEKIKFNVSLNVTYELD